MVRRSRKYWNGALRSAGLLLLGSAFLIGRHLFAAADAGGKYRLSAYLLALVFVLAVSVGAALALLGVHLFDRIELAPRWTIHAGAGRSTR